MSDMSRVQSESTKRTTYQQWNISYPDNMWQLICLNSKKVTWSQWIIIRISSKWMRSPLKITVWSSRKWNLTLKTEGCDVISSATAASFWLLTWSWWLPFYQRTRTKSASKAVGKSQVSSYHRCQSETDTSTEEACTLLLGNYIQIYQRFMSVHSMVILDLESLVVWFCCLFSLVILVYYTSGLLI